MILFCLPYAGGSESIYYKWKNHLHTSIQVVLIELKGRGKRFNEFFYESLEEAVDDIFENIKEKIVDDDFAIYGHSMGSLLAYELYYKIYNENGKMPKHMFFSGYKAPSIIRERENTYNLPDYDFMKKIMELGGTPEELMNNQELLQIFLPSKQADIIVSTPIHGRNHKDLENVIGVFINTVAIRSKIGKEMTYKDYLLQVKEKSIKAFENQDYQYDEIIDNIKVKRDQSREVLTDIMFTMQNIDYSQVEIKELKIRNLNFGKSDAKFDILLACLEEERNITITLNYRTSLYKKDIIELMAKHFKNIINQIDMEIMVKDISIFDDIELRNINEKFEKIIENSTLDIDFNF